MIDKPRLKHFLTLYPIAEQTWALRGGHEEVWRIKLSDPKSVAAFCALLPFLDGSHGGVESIIARLEEKGIDRKISQAILVHLEQNGLLEEAQTDQVSDSDAERFRRQITFFSRYTSEGGGKYQALLARTRIAVVGDGALASSLLEQLAKAGFGQPISLSSSDPEAAPEADGGPRRLPLDRKSIWPVDSKIAPPDLFLLALDSHDPELLEAMDSFSKARGIPWFLLRLFDRHKGWVGPLFIPGETASYVSLEARFRSNIPFYDEYEAFDRHLRTQDEPPPELGGLFAFFDLLAGLAVTEIVKFVTGIDTPRLAGRFLTVDLLTWDFDLHEVLRMPRLERGTHSGPSHFPWKEIPYADTPTRRT